MMRCYVASPPTKGPNTRMWDKDMVRFTIRLGGGLQQGATCFSRPLQHFNIVIRVTAANTYNTDRATQELGKLSLKKVNERT